MLWSRLLKATSFAGRSSSFITDDSHSPFMMVWLVSASLNLSIMAVFNFSILLVSSRLPFTVIVSEIHFFGSITMFVFLSGVQPRDTDNLAYNILPLRENLRVAIIDMF